MSARDEFLARMLKGERLVTTDTGYSKSRSQKVLNQMFQEGLCRRQRESKPGWTARSFYYWIPKEGRS